MKMIYYITKVRYPAIGCGSDVHRCSEIITRKDVAAKQLAQMRKDQPDRHITYDLGWQWADAAGRSEIQKLPTTDEW